MPSSCARTFPWLHWLDNLARGDFGSHLDLVHSDRTGVERWSNKPEVDGSLPDLTDTPSERAKLIAS